MLVRPYIISASVLAIDARWDISGLAVLSNLSYIYRFVHNVRILNNDNDYYLNVHTHTNISFLHFQFSYTISEMYIF